MPTIATSESLTVSMLLQREQKEINAIGKTTKAAREAYKGLLI